MDRHPRRWLILIVLCLSTLVLVVDNMVLTVAIPTIAEDLKASAQDLQWILDSYTRLRRAAADRGQPLRQVRAAEGDGHRARALRGGLGGGHGGRHARGADPGAGADGRRAR